MGKPQGDVDWYSGESRRQGIPPRCPFASVELCPRYFDSVEFLGRIEVTTSLPAADLERLDKKWHSWMPPLVEQQQSSLRSEDGLRFVSGICPEIGFDIFGHFATGFHWYADELDADLAHARLAREGVPNSDPRWNWATIHPEHYTECRLYSILSATAGLLVQKTTRAGKAGISPALRWSVLARDGYKCTYCGRHPPDVVLEVDHKVSEAEGGKTELANLVTACRECNRGKGSRSARM